MENTPQKNTSNIFIAAIIALVVIAAIAFFMMQGKTQNNSSSQAGNGNAGTATLGSMPVKSSGLQGAPKDTQETP